MNLKKPNKILQIHVCFIFIKNIFVFQSKRKILIEDKKLKDIEMRSRSRTFWSGFHRRYDSNAPSDLSIFCFSRC